TLGFMLLCCRVARSAVVIPSGWSRPAPSACLRQHPLNGNAFLFNGPKRTNLKSRGRGVGVARSFLIKSVRPSYSEMLMLSKKRKDFLSRTLLLISVICVFAGCRGVEAKKAQEPSPLLEVQFEEAKNALSAKEEDNASLTRQLEAAKQDRQREYEELKKQFDE